MEDYYTPTMIQQTIPEADMTPLERLLLSHIFESERDEEGWYFYSESGPADMIMVERAALESALAASELDVDSTTNGFVRELLADLRDEKVQNGYLDIDLSITSWEFIVQDVVRRSSTLKYVSAVSSFTCSRIRPDGFGGAVVVISADAILSKSTSDSRNSSSRSRPRAIAAPIARRAKPRSLPASPEDRPASPLRRTRLPPHAR